MENFATNIKNKTVMSVPVTSTQHCIAVLPNARNNFSKVKWYINSIWKLVVFLCTGHEISKLKLRKQLI